jgi:M6 family metalloprotease-like protein
MASIREVAHGLAGAIGGRFVPAWGYLVCAEWAGRITAVDPATGFVKHLGSGYTQPEDIVATADGSALFVSERTGALLQVDPHAADRINATPLATGLTAPHQLALTKDESSVLVVEYAPGGGRLLRIDVATNSVVVIAGGLNGGVGLLLDDTETIAYVTEQGAGGRIIAIDLKTGAARPLVTGLIAPFFLAWADDTGKALLIAERDPANRLSLVDPTSASPTCQVLAALPLRPSCPTATPSEVFVFCDASIAALDVSAGLAPSVTLRMPRDPLFVGGYARVPVDIGGFGLSFDGLSFVVVEGPEAGALSPSRDATFDPAKPEVMLLGGSVPGKYTLLATVSASGAPMASGPFELTAEWVDQAAGPAIAFTGPSETWVTGGAWGGGPVGPQNVNVLPASGTRRVAMILVDTTDAVWPSGGTTLGDARTLWSNELLGTTPDVDGIRRSVHHYYQEVSDGRFDVGLVGSQVFGPFHLPNGWTSYFDWNTDRSVWWANGNYFQAAVTAAQDAVDFDQVDTIVVVMNSLAASVQMGTTLFSWPVAGGGNFTYRRPGQTTTTQRSFRALNMPANWQVVDSRRIHETLSHEIGHNLGLPDLYMNVTGFDATISARDVGAWDLMSQENPLPHLSIAHKMMLGWMPAAAVRSFDFASGGGVDQTLTLQASEAMGPAGPPAGRVGGIEIRRADGWNYYFEYRAGQMADIGDRALAPNRTVLGTDVVSGSFAPPQARRSIVLLAKDVDGDGPVLSVGGTDYEEDDPSGPAKFQLDLVSSSADSAQVRVRYGAGGRPDPSIRPWPGGDNWRSPDIEVRNAKSDADASWLNVPWAGHTNRVVAKVRNGGNFLAKGVAANFFVKDFSITGAPEFSIGSDHKDISPGATVEFETNWTPPANTPTDDAHYCVVVRIPLFQDPANPAIVELTELNNVAQSNYTRFISASASPSERGMSHVTVNNPYSERTRLFVVAQQTMPYYRTYLEHQWLWLDPGETRRIGVMYESLAGDPRWDGQIREMQDRFYEHPNRVSLIGLMENPYDEQLHVADVSGGANIVVASGRRTRIVDLELNKYVARGRVITVDDGRPATRGQVVVSAQPDGRPTGEQTRTASVLADGRFVLELALRGCLDGECDRKRPAWRKPAIKLQVHYLGAFMLADCDSDIAWELL